MNWGPVVLEISSDEEGGWADIDDVSNDWLSDLLSGVASEAEESDDVVVLDGDSCVSTIEKQDCMASSATKGGSGNHSDDDCLVLDCDPDNPVSAVDDAGNGSDDLLIVGEKGQLACRDYPHPRHLCANFPFRTTPHEKYCDLCHCYVCDSHAPCIYWGTGSASTDHCNSTDKEEVWRNERKYIKQIIAAAPHVQNLPDTALSTKVPPHNTLPTHSFSESLSLGLSPQETLASNSIELIACSATSFGTIGNHRPNPHLQLHSKNRYPHYPNRSQVMPRTRTISRERGSVGALGPRFVSPYSKFKRAGSSGSAFPMVNRSGQGSYDSNRIYTAVQPRNQSTQATQGGDIQLKKWQDFLSGIDSEQDTFQNYSVSNSNGGFTDFQSCSVPFQPQVQACNQSIPQLNANQNMHELGNPAMNAADPDPLEFDFSWSLNDASQSTPVDSTVPSVHPFEQPAVMQSEGQHLQHTLGSFEFHEENWMYGTLEHQPPVPETLSDPALSDLNLLPVQSSTMDPSMLELESPWVI